MPTTSTLLLYGCVFLSLLGGWLQKLIIAAPTNNRLCFLTEVKAVVHGCYGYFGEMQSKILSAPDNRSAMCRWDYYKHLASWLLQNSAVKTPNIKYITLRPFLCKLTWYELSVGQLISSYFSCENINYQKHSLPSFICKYHWHQQARQRWSGGQTGQG